MSVSEPNARLRIIRLFSDYKSLLCVRKWDKLLTENPKVAVAHICDLLKPEALKVKIENDLQLSHQDLRKNWKAFYQYVVKQAIFCDSFVPIRRHGQMKQPSELGRPSFSSSISRSGIPSSSTTINRSALALKPTSSAVHGSRSAKLATSSPTSNKSVANREPPRCLNKSICNGYHYVKDCPKTDEEQKRALLKTFHESRREERGLRALNSRANVDDSESLPPIAGSGRYQAMLANTISITINGDYGADHCALSQDHLSRCADKGIFVPVLPLRTQISMSLAMGDRSNPDARFVVAKSKARISTIFQVPTGPLRLRNLEYLVFDEPMDEVILACPILQTIGFDLDKHLADVLEKYHDTDFAHIGFSPAVFDTAVETPLHKPSRLSQLLLHCTEQNSNHSQPNSQTAAACFYGDSQADIDENETREDVVTGIHDDTEVQTDLHQLLSESAQQGLPKSLSAQLGSLVLEYSDIFRNKMGSDSPAKATPMIIRLR